MFKKRIGQKRLFAVALALTVVCMMLSGCTMSGEEEPAAGIEQNGIAKAASYTVTIDINPSIQLTIEDGIVTQAAAYNDDGEMLLLSTDVYGLDAQAAMDVMLQALIDGGYINSEDETEPYLIITVSGNEDDEDSEIAEQLREGAQDMLDDLALGCRIGTAEVSDEDIEAAKALGLSVGRYLLLQYIAGVDGITIEEAIAQYGSTKIGVLIDMYEGAGDLFDEGDGNGRGSFLEGLTDEQIQFVNAAIKTFKKDLQAAERIYHDTFKQIQSKYRKTIKNLRKQYKDDPQALAQQLEAQEQNMIGERTAALAALEQSVNDAVAKVLLAVADIPMDMDAFTAYINNMAIHEIDKEYNFHAFQNEFVAGDAAEQDEPKADQEDEGDQDQDEGEDDQGLGQSKPKTNNGKSNQ